MRRLARFLLRWIAPVAAVAAVWVAWWVISQLPLREVRIDSSPCGYFPAGLPSRTGILAYRCTKDCWDIVAIDLSEGRETRIPAEKRLGVRIADNHEWIATHASRDQIVVFDLPNARRRCVIPYSSDQGSRWDLHDAVISPDSRLISVYVPDESCWETWDTKTGQRVLRLNAVQGVAAISESRTRIAACLTDSAAVGVWSLPEGNRIGTVPLWGKLEAIHFSPDGRLLIGCLASAGPDGRGAAPDIPVAATTAYLGAAGSEDVSKIAFRLISADLGNTGSEFVVKFRPSRLFDPRSTQFTPDGRFLRFWTPAAGNLWDTRCDPPLCLDAVVGIPSPRVSYPAVSLCPVSAKVTVNDSGRSRVYDLESLPVREIETDSAEPESSTAGFSPNGKWRIHYNCVQNQMSPRTRGWISKLLGKWFDEDFHYSVTIYDSHANTVVNRIRASMIAAWPLQSDTIWTDDSEPGYPSGKLTFRQWPIHAPRPPIWLWAGTALVAAVMLLRLLRALRGRTTR